MSRIDVVFEEFVGYLRVVLEAKLFQVPAVNDKVSIRDDHYTVREVVWQFVPSGSGTHKETDTTDSVAFFDYTIFRLVCYVKIAKCNKPGMRST
jgi:hypothetical protein